MPCFGGYMSGVRNRRRLGVQELAERPGALELEEEKLQQQVTEVENEQARLQLRVTDVEKEQEQTKKEITEIQNAFKEVQETTKEQSSTTSTLIHSMFREQGAQALANRNMNSSLRLFLRMYPGVSEDNNGTPLRLKLTDIAGGQYTRVGLGNDFSHVFDGEVLVDSNADEIAATFGKQFFDSPPHTVTIYLFLGMSGSGKTTLFNRVIAQVGASTDRISLEEWGINGSIRTLACTSEVVVAKTLANSNSSRTACCGVFQGMEGLALFLFQFICLLPFSQASVRPLGVIWHLAG
ncbi:hypothetical protein L211DRAFT_850632 [Terfezia boudieri ATCC MYA-4762]|uniref:Uncharacterized protein n=1 Tax=Terfezia boudieri ATCC MYA-4762 TaxID=1051890 RepID=A0A3N4LNR2_9PEZI|nr:hypothetical protein L211DRAFT_850632 [Terfezia boudieri ATCC MYA-4762]